jgi:hypothetical protein
LAFHQTPVPFFEAPAKAKPPKMFPVEAVSLLSGGLDSLAGGVDLLAPDDGTRVLFVGHYDSPGPRGDQARLAKRLDEKYPTRSDIIHVRVAYRPEKAAEETLRCRSFVFIALGLYAAAAGTEVPLLMFENGLIALNIPPTPSRRGSRVTAGPPSASMDFSSLPAKNPSARLSTDQNGWFALRFRGRNGP